MASFEIIGGKPLKGEVTISGSKNSVLAILAATLLTDEVCRIENVPYIEDVIVMISILRALGAKVKRIDQNTWEIDPCTVMSMVVPDRMARQLRASYYFLGALLGRFNRAYVPEPGGCEFCVRPMDQHMKAFKALSCTVEEGSINSIFTEKLKGATIYFDKVSVGSTINAILASCKADGVTILENAAREPHIVDLANFINSMGGSVRGAGTDTIKITGVKKLHGTNYCIIPDQIEAGTFMMYAAITGGDIVVRNVIPKHLESCIQKLGEMNVNVIKVDSDALRVNLNGEIRACDIQTMPHPGIPTDMQPIFSALASKANGRSVIYENVWDQRNLHIAQMRRANIDCKVEGNRIIVNGGRSYSPAILKSTDLRAGAALIGIALAAKGRSEIEDIHLVDRGYENLTDKITSLGGTIKRIQPELDIDFENMTAS